MCYVCDWGIMLVVSKHLKKSDDKRETDGKRG